MAIRKANANWQGDLKSGKGRMALASGAWEGQYSFSSRFEEGTGSNPEELIAAAHAGCFSMALSNILAEAGHTPDSVSTEAKVHLEFGDDGPSIPRIELVTEAVVPGLSEDEFHKHAEAAKEGCPVSKVLAGAEVSLDARLK
ncbi:MAG TPA: OsmC family protein [Wenzhouxiangella sp.]|nr:OsmC family protein [Wenzhouxiangella sp.]